MASSGSPTPAWRSGPECRLAHAPAALALVGVLAGCAPTIRYGSPPRIDRLDTLRPRVSRTADVRSALGEPRGRGEARLPAEPTLRTIWFYEYAQAAGSRIDLKMLLVFFEHDTYDGHLWFSSANLLEEAE